MQKHVFRMQKDVIRMQKHTFPMQKDAFPMRKHTSPIQKHAMLSHKGRREPAVLIDDYPKNIREWQRKGGIGILHTSASSTISQLRKLGY